MSADRIKHHSLKVYDARESLEFYTGRLGMHISGHETGSDGSADRYHLTFGEPGSSELELICDHADSPIGYEHDQGDLYWKTGITVPDVDIARDRLYFAGVDVSEPRQFRNVGYVCHLKDPDGFVIELLQHDFAANHKPVAPDPAYKLGSQPTLGQITIRTKNPALSVPFYRDLLGMTLLSRQSVDPPGFSLYFFAFTDEMPPSGDIEAVEDREWLWQRPYTTIELQHVWGTEESTFAYRTDEDGPLGFRGISLAVSDIDGLRRRAATFSSRGEFAQDGDALILRDPDGTRIAVTAV